MILFLGGLTLLAAGYFTYGRLIEHIVGPDDRATPAVRSLRMIAAEAVGVEQRTMRSRVLVVLPLVFAAYALSRRGRILV